MVTCCFEIAELISSQSRFVTLTPICSKELFPEVLADGIVIAERH